MNWYRMIVQWLQWIVAIPLVLGLILFVDVAAYFAGLLYWYGPVMSSPLTPILAWPFIPDCPLFGLLGGIGLLIVTARKFWSEAARRIAQILLLGVGSVAAAVWLSAYFPWAAAWRQTGSTFALFAISLLIGGAFFRSAPVWLLALISFGQIKYGIWTITAWLLFWRNTAAVFGSPSYTFDSVLMTISHIGLVAQGLFLLTYFRPDRKAALVCLGWFGLSDFVDYGLGWYPSIPQMFIPLSVMQWSTIAVTLLLSLAYLIVGWPARRSVVAVGLAEAQS
jgi:uncharacterized membrane protein YpjA